MKTSITAQGKRPHSLTQLSPESFFHTFPLKPLGVDHSTAIPTLFVYNCLTLSICKLSLTAFTFKQLFLHFDKAYFPIKAFEAQNIFPSAYLEWIRDRCSERHMLYLSQPAQYPHIPANISLLFKGTQERRLLAESYCLHLESRQLESLQIPRLEDHPVHLLQQLSKELRITDSYIYIPEGLQQLFTCITQ